MDVNNFVRLKCQCENSSWCFSEKLQADDSRSTKEAPTWTSQVEGHFFQEEDRVWYRDCRRSHKCDRTFRFKEVEPPLKQTVSGCRDLCLQIPAPVST